MHIKVGHKSRWVEMPEEYVRVTSGNIKEGDLFLRCPDYKVWLPVEEDDLGDDVLSFDCIIRKIAGK